MCTEYRTSMALEPIASNESFLVYIIKWMANQLHPVYKNIENKYGMHKNWDMWPKKWTSPKKNIPIKAINRLVIHHSNMIRIKNLCFIHSPLFVFSHLKFAEIISKNDVCMQIVTQICVQTQQFTKKKPSCTFNISFFIHFPRLNVRAWRN